MLKIQSINAYTYENKQPVKSSKSRLPQTAINLTKQNTLNQVDTVSFKGFYFSEKNRRIGLQIAKAIKDPLNRRIAIMFHSSPDADAIGSAIALARLIRAKTGKTASILTEHPLSDNLRLIDTNDEITVVSRIIHPEQPAENVARHFGKFDLAIGLDTAVPELFDERLYKGIFRQARSTIDIDHHPKTRGNFADITLVDSSKKSAAQLIMEFFRSFGINRKQTTAYFTDPISHGLVGDTFGLRRVDSEACLDAAKLGRTSNIEGIRRAFLFISPTERNRYQNLLRRVRFTPDGTIAFFTTTSPTSTRTCGQVLDTISQMPGVKYYFGIRPDRNGEPLASIRSNGQDIGPLIKQIGGDGRDGAYILRKPDMSFEDMESTLIEHLRCLQQEGSFIRSLLTWLRTKHPADRIVPSYI